MQCQVFVHQAELQYKQDQLAYLKKAPAVEASTNQRERQLESQSGQLRESIQRLEMELTREQSEIERVRENLRQLGTRPTLTERGGRQRSLEAPVSIP